MQIVIDIDENIYNRFTHNEVKPRCEITEEERFQIGADAIRLTRAFCNGTPIPDNATNGDIIKALFPKIDDNFSNVIDLRLWWNALYKVESEEQGARVKK